MPWCPNCKAEYQEGVTECADCKIELVDDIKEAEILIPFFQAEDRKVAAKLANFLEYSELNTSLDYDEENEVYVVSIPENKQMQAKKLYQAFYYVERERAMNGETDPEDSEETDLEVADPEASEDSVELADSASETTEQDDDLYENQTLDSEEEASEGDAYKKDTPSDEVTAFDEEEDNNPAVYVMKADQYKDLTGTVWVFLFFGVFGLIFVILNAIGTLSLLNGWIPITVMGTLFLVFIYIALSTNQKAKKVQAEIAAENKLTEEINKWLENNITESFLSSIHNDNISDELNYLKAIDKIKEMLIKEFGPQNLAYLDRLIEEYYNQNFDQE
ncbi:MAG TPA: hypothetical protein VN258_19340 [Mobilitalea sp.]|nr:hypothetical protein [Mobilitalea sp.]